MVIELPVPCPGGGTSHTSPRARNQRYTAGSPNVDPSNNKVAVSHINADRNFGCLLLGLPAERIFGYSKRICPADRRGLARGGLLRGWRAFCRCRVGRSHSVEKGRRQENRYQEK